MKKLFVLALVLMCGCSAVEKVAFRATPVNGKIEFSVEIFPQEVDSKNPRCKIKESSR